MSLGERQVGRTLGCHMFADDKHCFWQVRSKNECVKAVAQLGTVLEVLQSMKTRVNFGTSTVVYTLRDRAAEEVIAKYTRWQSGERCLVARGKLRDAQIPIADKLTYFGGDAYGAFETQSVKQRGERANQTFGSLHKVLRSMELSAKTSASASPKRV